jgi:PAS domain S-box-containing protein
MVGNAVLVERRLPPRAASAGAARRLVGSAVEDTAYAELADSARLAVSELVTNALVHAGTEIGVQVSLDDRGLLLEVHDGNPQTPVLRRHARESGTGRGLHMVQGLADDWGIYHRGDGKVVWARFGQAGDGPAVDVPLTPDAEVVHVELLDVPLLIHAAWQEHSTTLLREYLLMSLGGDDEMAAFQRHADACEALQLLAEQVPAPDIGSEPGRVMDDAVEPLVTAERLVLEVPRGLVGHFDVLDRMMNDAVAAADDGEMLVPGTQPEVREMRRWLCDQVLGQAVTGAEPEPYAADLHHDIASTPEYPDGWDATEVSGSSRALVASNDSGQIVAVSDPAAQMLGHAVPDLVGRRVLVLIPERFRQAHVAGMTLHVIDGRSALLESEVTVPVLLADGSEQLARLLVRPVAAGGGRVFVADLEPA